MPGLNVVAGAVLAAVMAVSSCTTQSSRTAALAPDHVHQVRYESFLEAPESGLRDVAAFLGLDLSDAELPTLAIDVEPERALAFRDDPQLVRLYRETAHHPLMQRLEYGDLSCLPAS